MYVGVWNVYGRFGSHLLLPHQRFSVRAFLFANTAVTPLVVIVAAMVHWHQHAGNKPGVVDGADPLTTDIKSGTVARRIRISIEI